MRIRLEVTYLDTLEFLKQVLVLTQIEYAQPLRDAHMRRIIAVIFFPH